MTTAEEGIVAPTTMQTPQDEPPVSGSSADDFRKPSVFDRSTTKRWGLLMFRTDHDTANQDWWFASIAIPLLAATIAPLANVLSIAALVSFWRSDLLGPDGQLVQPLDGKPIKDPSWVYGLNLASLICGYVGNVFLLMNFTNRIRYIIALPISIILWYISTAILIAIQVCMNKYAAPNGHETYTQAFWYGVIAAALYLICSMILMVNMVGYFLGHYPQQFNLTDSQRTLILQTFLFFIWLAGGAAIFQKIETAYGHQDWSFSDALYFCDVTILTVGFGDLVPTNALGRGLLIPYAIGGIIMLGLMISSISSFATDISHANIMQKRVNRQRLRTLARSTTRPEYPAPRFSTVDWNISSPQNARKLSAVEDPRKLSEGETARKPSLVKAEGHSNETSPPLIPIDALRTIKRKGTQVLHATSSKRITDRRHSLHHLKEEKERFVAMRQIQKDNAKFKQWSSLIVSTFVLCLFWFVGALVFWQVESAAQNMNYMDAIYFCFVSLTTIGYGDFAPVTNGGRPFFVVWSLLAVPSVTILISNMADTVIAAFKRGTEFLASFTLLPEYGIWRSFLDKHPWLLWKIERYEDRKSAEKRVAKGFETGPDPTAINRDNGPEAVFKAKTIDEIAEEGEAPTNPHDLAHKLSMAIRRTAEDFRLNPKRRYDYEEWVEFTELIRFSKAPKRDDEDTDDEDEGLIEWDWIGEDSPMMTEQTEPEWLLDRLCESMSRYTKVQRRGNRHRGERGHEKSSWHALDGTATAESEDGIEVIENQVDENERKKNEDEVRNNARDVGRVDERDEWNDDADRGYRLISRNNSETEEG